MGAGCTQFGHGRWLLRKRSTVAPPDFSFTKSAVSKPALSRPYLLKYGVPRHPPRLHRSIVLVDLLAHSRNDMDTFFSIVHPCPCVEQPHDETFVRENRWFGGRGYRGTSLRKEGYLVPGKGLRRLWGSLARTRVPPLFLFGVLSFRAFFFFSIRSAMEW